MSTAVAIVGISGSGKSTGIRTLDPASTFIINADKKSLPWKGWRSAYNIEAKNYLQSSDEDIVYKNLRGVAESWSHIKTIVIDTVNGIMIDEVMERAKQKGYDKWTDLAAIVYRLVDIGGTFRDDLLIYYLFHAEKPGDEPSRIKTSGKMLQGIGLESKFTTVLFAKPRINEGKVQYGLETHWNNSTAKSPDGMFASDFIPNDYKQISDVINAYEQ